MHAQRKRRSAGFSLVELMIVVMITGVLAAIAIPTFSDYIRKSRTSEATQFLGVIKLKQEAYRAEFGTYLGCSGPGMGDFVYVPGDAAAMVNEISVSFPVDNACFNTLGAKPDGAVRFGYGWIAGGPGDLAGAGGDVATALSLDPGDYDHYAVAEATADFNGDGTTMTFEVSTYTRGVFAFSGSNVAPQPLPRGWE